MQYGDLPDDVVRVKKCKMKRLEEQCQELAQQICGINNQIKIIMSYENSEDRVANLEQIKSEVESELRKKQEELATLKNSLQATD